MSKMRMKPRSDEYVEGEDELEELREKRLEMKKLKAERDLLKMKAEVERMRQELAKTGEASTSNPDEKATALGAMITSMIKAGVKPEEASEFLSKMSPEALATLSTLTSGNPYLPVFMYLASQSRNVNPQSWTSKDIVELNKSVYDLAEKIADKGKGEGEIGGVIRELLGLIRDMQNKQLLDKLDELKNTLGSRRSTLLEEILEDKEKFMRLKELFGGSANPEIQLKLEELRHRHEIEMKKLDLELLKLQSELAESKRKSKMFAYGLKKIGEAIVGGVEEASREYTYKPSEATQKLKCPNCGSEMPIAKPGEIVECPNCHKKYEVRVKGG